MAIDFDDILNRGGNELIQFLHYCVYSVQLAPIFILLARDYRMRPTVSGALALYANFCATGAPARIKADHVLAPRNLQLDQLVLRMTAQQRVFDEAQQQQQKEAEADVVANTEGRRGPPPPSPVIFLFDDVVAHVRGDLDGPLHTAARAFDPTFRPMQNLPGGRLNVGQRAFVENVWRPRVRPQLVAAGFWRAADLGQ